MAAVVAESAGNETGVPDLPPLLTRRTDQAFGFVYEGAVDAQAGYVSGLELARRQAVIARVTNATGAVVALTDFLGCGVTFRVVSPTAASFG